MFVFQRTKNLEDTQPDLDPSLDETHLVQCDNDWCFGLDRKIGTKSLRDRESYDELTFDSDAAGND